MYCKDCRFWERDEDSNLDERQFNLRTCRRIKMFWHSTEWSREGEQRVIKEECRNEKAFLQDGSDYRADLLTMPDFGCVQFVQK